MAKRKLNKEFQIRDIYHNQLRLCKNRGYPPPTYSVQQLKDWCLSQQKYHDLHNDWVRSNFDRMLSPSIDRINDYKTYSLNNIQLMTSGDNIRKGHHDAFNGINTKRSVAVIQKTLDGVFIQEFVGTNIAGRSLGKINGSMITAVCNGKRKTAYGFLWEYK